MAPIPNKRAFGLGIQADKLTESTAIRWFTGVTDITLTPQVSKRRPKYKTNNRIQTRRQKTVTSYAEIQVQGDVEILDFQPIARSGLGVPTVASGKDVYSAGGYNNPYVTAVVLMGLDEYWKMVGGRVNVVRWEYNAEQDTVSYRATIRGPRAIRVDGALSAALGGPNPTFTDSPGNPPFEAWQTVFKKGDTALALCISTANWEVNNNYNPFYCSPLVAPTAVTPPGMVPSRFREGEAEGTYELSYTYVGTLDGAGVPSSYQDFIDDTDELWIIEATDPKGQADEALTYLPTFRIELLRAAPESATMPLNDPDVMQTVRGALLLDDTLQTFMRVLMTPAT